MIDSQLVRCPSCDATNRVPLDKLAAGQQPVCGRCKTPLAVGHRRSRRASADGD